MTIHICDNVLSPAAHEALCNFTNESYFRIGWADTSDISRRQHQYLYSAWNQEDLDRTGFLQALKDERTLELIGGRTPVRTVVNLSVPSNVHFSHTHLNEDVLLFYLNTNWREEWAGETLFFDQERKNIIFASAYVPNRTIFFDGEIPHTIRPQSIIAPHYRYTLSIFFAKG